MKNSGYLIIVLLLVLVVGFLVSANLKQVSGSSDNIDLTTAQQITIGMQNGNYYPQTITVKANEPVAITLDNSVQGCFRSFTIKDLGVSKYSKNVDDKIAFIPTEPGTYRFACSMGMGFGTLIVE